MINIEGTQGEIQGAAKSSEYNRATWTVTCNQFGKGDLRNIYNLVDLVVRSTDQGWTAVYEFLDNPGMWNIMSQNLKHWYLGQELYIRVHANDPNPAKERPPPENLLFVWPASHFIILEMVIAVPPGREIRMGAE
ncbi:Monocopper oxidase protein SKU5 [Spatholobus suberectus]|nr:Monocopper oxidase protein SKU5 [Spatholobus suberectus]